MEALCSEFGKYKGKSPTVWQSARGHWLLAHVTSDDAIVHEEKTLHDLTRMWEKFLDYVRSGKK